MADQFLQEIVANLHLYIYQKVLFDLESKISSSNITCIINFGTAYFYNNIISFESDLSAGPFLITEPIIGFILYSTSRPKSFNGLLVILMLVKNH